MNFYMSEFEDPPLPRAERFHTVTPIPDSGEDDYEILAVVEPPIEYEATPITVVRIRARNRQPLTPDGDLFLQGQKRMTVIVSAVEGDPDFGIRIASLANHLPELWRRGGYWQWFSDAMAAFVAREGHADVPLDHVEDGFDLGRYADGVRRAHGHGTLREEQEEYLELLPGWRW